MVMFPCLIKGPENNCQEQTHNEPKIENHIYKWINFANYCFAEQTIYVLKTEILHFSSLKSADYKRERLQIKSGL